MHVRNVSRWVSRFVFVGATVVTGISCGGSGSSETGDASISDGAVIQLNLEGGSTSKCVSKTCAHQGYTCGPNSDGCGTVIQCGSCTGNAFCGGGGYSKCGDSTLAPDGGTLTPCVPTTCAAFPAGTCGIQGDGCGGQTTTCTGAGAPSGSLCASPEFCGGGGPGLCGGSTMGNSSGVDSGGIDGGASSGGDGSSGGSTCNPKTCSSFPSGTCGQQSDGCSGLTAICAGAGGPSGSLCASPEFCGGGGPGLCGGGMNPDGSVTSTCVPTTCQAEKFNCGQAADGCGGILSCGSTTCPAPQACGAQKPNVCGSNVPCGTLCQQQVACDGGMTTTLTGTVVAATLSKYLPTGVTYGDPVPNVLVYIPQSPVAAFVPRAKETAAQQCSTCGADVSGNPLVQTTTAYNGTFTLSNVPVGSSIPLVIQLGRWRRQFVVNITNSCAANQVNASGMPVGILMMPATQAQGDIPLTAISTGNVDAMECVLLKMGIDSTEFTINTTTTPKNGRVHMYLGNGAVSSLGGTPAETVLMGTSTSTGTYNNYDQAILPCWGVDPTTNNSVNKKTAAELANLVTYGNAGGHFFATHYSYAWLYDNNPFNTTAQWDVNADTSISSMTGVVNQSVPPTTPATTPGVFVQWLNYIGALSNSSGTATPPNPADVTIANARHDVDNVLLQSVEWIDGNDPNPGENNAAMLLHYTFDTPVGATSGQCGHSIFSDFHVANSATGTGTCKQNSDCSSDTCTRGACAAAQFPSQSDIAAYCGAIPMTSQEKILEYMIWDLASCVPGLPVSTCTPLTCASYPTGTCGQQGDGCGGLTANCGGCASGQSCGSGGTAGVCGTPDAGPCTPETCASYPSGTCGQQTDGCGGLTADCNNCPSGVTCGGGGVAGVCGSPDAGTGNSSCTPLTCAAYPNTCGVQSDGCGGLTQDCNPCTAPQTCGGAGVSGQCGTPPSTTCTPQPCPASIQCGPASDGCGGVIASCGTCTAPQTCGGGGTSGVCGGNSGCTPLTCAQQNISCGPAGDGCGNVIASCGTCTAPQTCGGGGTPGACGGGSPCVPETCAQLNISCGPAGDGCGNLIPSCGTCAPPGTCGGSGVPGQCTAPVH